MGRVSIGSHVFKTKREAELFIRALLGRYASGQTIGGTDLEFVSALLAQHPNRQVIEACGIARIQVQWLDDAGQQRRFLAIRTDHSMRDFTWRHAVYPRSALDCVRRVCRGLVTDQTEACRRAAFREDISLVCPVSGLRITRKVSEVDHAVPNTFAALVDGWLKSLMLTADDIEVVPAAGYQEPDRFQDVFLEESWREYHEINAKLRVVHPHANRSLLRRRNPDPPHEHAA